MIRKLSHFDQPIVSQEPETTATQQPAVPVSPRLGIAGNADGFETTTRIPAGHSNLNVQNQFSAAPVATQETVDASSMFGSILQPFASPFDAHYEKKYSRSGLIGGEKIKLNANVNAHPHGGIKTSTEPNITLANDQNLNIGDTAVNGAHAALSENMSAEENILESIGGTIVDGAGDAVDFVTDLPSDLVDLFWEGTNAVGTAIEDTGKAIDDGASAIGEFFSDTPVGDGARWLGEFAEDAGDFAWDVFDHSIGAVNDVGLFIGDAAKETPIPEVLDAAGEAVVDVTNFFANLILYPGATIDEAIEDTGNTIEEVAEDTGDIIIAGIRISGEVVEDIVNGTGNFIDNAAETVGGVVSDGIDMIGEGLDDLF